VNSGNGGLPTEPLVPLGVIIGAHGVRGELRVKLHNPSSAALDRRNSIILRDGARTSEHRVTARRRHQELLLIALEGCVDRDAAIALRGREVCVPRSQLPALAPGEYYLTDLVGLRAERPDGQSIGDVTAVIPYPTVDAISVRELSTTERAGVLEVPLLAPYLVEVRVADGVIVLDHLEDFAPEKG
jgi:16S rRNA processing protein RimM